MLGLIRNLGQGIRNIIYWFPVIWKDRHWDYAFLLYILRHKLEAMHVSSLYWTGREKATEDIGLAVSLLDKVIEDEFCDYDLQEGQRKKREAIDALFGIIKDNIETWWD